MEIEHQYLHYEVGSDVAWWATPTEPESPVFDVTHRPNEPRYGYMQYQATILGVETVAEADPEIVPAGADPDWLLIKLQMVRQ